MATPRAYYRHAKISEGEVEDLRARAEKAEAEVARLRSVLDEANETIVTVRAAAAADASMRRRAEALAASRPASAQPGQSSAQPAAKDPAADLEGKLVALTLLASRDGFRFPIAMESVIERLRAAPPAAGSAAGKEEG